MKKITSICFCRGLLLAVAIFFAAGPSAAEDNEGYSSLIKPKFLAGPHPKGDAPDVFAGGLQTIEDAVLYRCAVKALYGEVRVGPVYFQIAGEEITPGQITNIRLVADENGNGSLDPEENRVLARGEWAADGRRGVIFTGPFTVEENETLYLLLIADISDAPVFSRLLVSASETYFGAANARGETVLAEKFGSLPTVEHFLENPLAIAVLELTEDKIVGRRVTLEGYLYYRIGVRFDEEKLKNTVIDGWKIVRLTLGHEEGVDSHRRYIAFTLELPAKSRVGKYKIPSFTLYFFDLDDEKEKYISTPSFSAEKTDLIIRSDVFPRRVSLGEPFRYRIEFTGVPRANITPDFFSELKLQKKIGVFDIERLETEKRDGDEFTAIVIVLTLAAYDYAGETGQIPEIEIPYYLPTGAEAAILIHKLPAVKVDIGSLLTEEPLRFRPLADRAGTIFGHGRSASAGARKAASLFFLLVFFCFAAQYPWLLLKKMRQKNEPLLARQMTKRRFKYCAKSYPAADDNADNLRWFANAFAGYVKALCDLRAEVGSLGFGAALKEKCARGYELYERIQDSLCDFAETDRQKLVAEARDIVAAMEKKCKP